MRYLLLLLVVACGRPRVEGDPCTADQVAAEECEGDQRWVCETTAATPEDPMNWHPKWFASGRCD